MNFYVSLGDIQDSIDNFNRVHNNHPNLPDILHELYKNQNYICSESELPDISGFALMDDDEFLKKIRTLYFRFPGNILTNIEDFDVVPMNADLTVISQFWNINTFIHMHDCFEINYIFKGQCEFVFLDEKRILKEGDFCIISPFTDQSFSSVVRKLKMRAAVQLLETTNDSIEKIAEDVGYNSSDHFYRVFTDYYGMSPTKYRKIHQET